MSEVPLYAAVDLSTQEFLLTSPEAPTPASFLLLSSLDLSDKEVYEP